LANVRATGRACLLVDEYGEDWSALWWVRLDAAARILEPDDGYDAAAAGLAALADKYQQYADRPPSGPMLALTVRRWSGWSAGPAFGDPPTGLPPS
jgi:PPOX class probable F420-dependent enzyme